VLYLIVNLPRDFGPVGFPVRHAGRLPDSTISEFIWSKQVSKITDRNGGSSFRLATGAIFTIGMLLSHTAHATNGYFAHGYGTKTKGMAGAGVALPQDAMAAATNPAGMAFVGERADVGLALFSPMREYKASGGINPPPWGIQSDQYNGRER
jgi:hypothetical protein